MSASSAPTANGGAHYFPSDLIAIFGEVDVASLSGRMKCEWCEGDGTININTILPTGSEAVGMRIRRLIAIKILRVPVW